ncbi:MAG: hypothetical protein KDK70_02050, partial [Myxococcales bacterium]|nr:hypothetical protein [Myxococcales bacterium]
FAVVPWGARIYVEPRVGAPSVRLGWSVAEPPPWPSGGTVVRVVGHRDGFVEIASVVHGEVAHCEAVLDADALDVRLYVSPWSLASVLTRPVEVEVEAGAEAGAEVEGEVEAEGTVVLRPGALVRPIAGDPRGRYAVRAGGIQVQVSLPDDAVGNGYVEPQPLSMPSQREWELPDAHTLHDAEGWPIEVDQSFGHDVAVESAWPLGARHRIALVSPCARVTGYGDRAPRSISFGRDHIDFGLGGSDVRLPDGALRARALVAPSEPEPSEPSEPFDAFDTFDIAEEVPVRILHESEDVIGELEPAVLGVLQGESPVFFSSGFPELVVEAGAPVYLTTAGPAAGTLNELRVFSDDTWVVGERLCLHTAFSMRFDPALAVCFDAAEAQRRSSTTDAHDFGRGTVEPGPIRVGPGHDEALVAQALRRHRRDLRRCYDEALAQDLDLTGSLELQLDTSAQGAVDDVRLRSTWLGPVIDCAIDSARTWSMPPTRDGKPGRIIFRVELSLR